MTFSTKKIYLGLFIISYLFFLSFSILGHIPRIGGYLNLLTNAGVILLCVSILFQIKKYTKKELAIILFLFFFSIVLISTCKDFTLFKITLFLSAIKNIKIETCISLDFSIRLFLVILVLILYKLNIAPDITSYYDGITRHSLGFTNPNTLGMHILILCFDILYLNRHNISKIKILLIILLVIFSDVCAGSRTSTYISILAIILVLIYKNNKSFLKNKIVYKIITNSVLIMSIITFCMYILYKTGAPLGISLNEILSNRLYNIDIYSQTYNISFFGNDNTNMGLTLDTAYAYSLYIYGIFFYLLLIYSFHKLFKKLYHNQSYVLIIIMFCFVIYGLSEKLWLSIDYNIFMSVFAVLIYNSVPKKYNSSTVNSVVPTKFV